MFPNASPHRARRRTGSILQEANEKWLATAGSWFDGTLPSVDARLARCDKLIHQLRTAGPDFLGAQRDLQAERDVIAGLRESMLNAHQDRSTFAPPRASEAQHQINMVAARAFVRENIEAAHWPEELAERARRHASLHEPRADAEAFAATCLRVASTVPRPSPARTASTTTPDFEDHHLFL